MQITELPSKGLKREYDVTVSAGDIEKLLKERLQDIGKQVKLPGFRPGKIPGALLEQRYKGSALKDVLEECLNKAVKEVVKKFDLNPALRPNITLTTYEIGDDLVAHVDLEILPTIGEINLEGFSFENHVVAIPDAEVDNALEALTKSYRKAHPLKKARKLKAGDIAIIDFEGYVGKDPIEGGSGKDYRLEVGSGAFIPGFEDQLIGSEKGDAVEVKVHFPKEYHDAKCADQKAHFSVTIKDIHEFEPLVLDDAFAAELKFASLKDMREAIRGRIAKDYQTKSVLNTKRNVLDALIDKFSFEVPQGLIDLEFDNIWGQLLQELGVDPKAADFSKALKEASGAEEEELRKNYSAVAERRVFLGILLSEIGKRHDVKVSSQDLTDALMAKAMEFPGQEREVFDYYRNNEAALSTLRAPVFEQKIVDFILGKSTVKETPLSPEEFAKMLAREEEAAEKKIFSKETTKKK